MNNNKYARIANDPSQLEMFKDDMIDAINGKVGFDGEESAAELFKYVPQTGDTVFSDKVKTIFNGINGNGTLVYKLTFDRGSYGGICIFDKRVFASTYYIVTVIRSETITEYKTTNLDSAPEQKELLGGTKLYKHILRYNTSTIIQFISSESRKYELATRYTVARLLGPEATEPSYYYDVNTTLISVVPGYKPYLYIPATSTKYTDIEFRLRNAGPGTWLQLTGNTTEGDESTRVVIPIDEVTDTVNPL